MAYTFDNIPSFVFVIDTNQYAGNFEREMCAYITGIIGDCHHGQEYQRLFFESLDLDIKQRDSNFFFEEVAQIADEHGCKRPVSIWPTKGRVNLGKGKCFDEDSKEAKKSKRIYPAYESVGIFFRNQPSAIMLRIMIEKANQFCEMQPLNLSVPNDIKIKGFRLIKVNIVFGEINI